MDTADNCCGNDIGFTMSFRLICGALGEGLQSVELTNFDIDRMEVHQDMYDGALQVDELDLSGLIEGTVKDSWLSIRDGFSIPWAGESMGLSRFLHRMISYNARHAAAYDVSIIAGGGIASRGHILKALCNGEDNVICVNLLEDTEESPVRYFQVDSGQRSEGGAGVLQGNLVRGA